MTEKKKPFMTKKRWLIALVAFVLVFSVSLGMLMYSFFGPDGFDADKYKAPSDQTVSDGEQELRKNPIDFATLKADNADVCAWITIPNTNVDYPIFQSSADDDNFYLNRGADKKYNANGSLYIQRINSYDFSDPNTVVYGHNMRNGSMFRTLHNFRDAEFFKANEYFYVYTPGHIMTYRIFAAYRYDNRLILGAFDFSDPVVYENYLQECLNPTSMIRNVREGVELTADDRIVTLSTCISDARYRYLVQGVLIKDEVTQ